MLQYVNHSLTQCGAEIVENQVRVDFWHVRQLLVNIMSQDDILQAKVYCRPNREMRDNHTIWLASMLMENDHVSEVFVPAQIHQIFQHIPTPVDSLSIGHDDGHFFQELEKPGRRVSRSGDQDLWVSVEHVRILIIDVAARDYIMRQELLILFASLDWISFWRCCFYL